MKEVRHVEPIAQGKFPRFPADSAVVLAAEHLLLTKVGRMDEVCEVLLEDPVVVLEILAQANRQFHANEKPAIWSIKVALVRLGTEKVLDILDELKEEMEEDASPVRTEFESLRLRARKIGKIARILAEIVDPQRKEEFQTAALMTEVGHMYALQRFKSRYIKAAKAGPRTGLAYRIEQELRLDVEKFRLDYLADKWFPQALLFVFDPDIKCRTNSESALRFVTEASEELLDAGEKIERYSAELPGKSPLRYLNLTEVQRSELVRRVAELLELQFAEKRVEPKADVAKVAPVVVPIKKPEPSKVIYFEAKVEYIETSQAEFDRSLNHFSEQNQRVFQILKELAEVVETGTELIEEVLGALTEEGPFKRASILEFSRDSCSFKLIAQVGSRFEMVPPVAVNDPWSPLARASTEIRSFSYADEVDPLAPLGTNAFAISPLRGKANQRLALYADCGEGGVVPFEARRVFRAAIGVLNSVLPTLPE